MVVRDTAIPTVRSQVRTNLISGPEVLAGTGNSICPVPWLVSNSDLRKLKLRFPSWKLPKFHPTILDQIAESWMARRTLRGNP